jgi:hypothetical protein
MKFRRYHNLTAASGGVLNPQGIKEIRKDKKTQLEEMRDGEYCGQGSVADGMRKFNKYPAEDVPMFLETKQVVGGEPLATVKRRIRLLTDPD